MDADKFFAVAGAGYKGLPVDEDGTLTMTRRIRVIGEGTNCPDDKRVMYEEVKGGEERKIVEPIEPQKPIPATIITEENSGSDIRLELEGDGAFICTNSWGGTATAAVMKSLPVPYRKKKSILSAPLPSPANVRDLKGLRQLRS